MKALPFKISLLILVLLPGSFSKIIAGTESLKEGLIVSSVIASLILLTSGQKISTTYVRQISIKFSFLLFFLIFHGVLFIFNDEFNALRFTISIAFLVLLFALWTPIIGSIVNATTIDLDSALRLCYWILLVDGLLSTMIYIYIGNRAMFFSSEPSHFALTFLPFLCYMLLKDRSILHLVGALWVAVLINNLTLLIGIGFLVIFYYRNRLVLMVAAFLLIFLTVFISPTYIDYVFDRLTLSIDTENLTSLVFMSGYERAFETLAQGHLLGVGFQQMGFNGPPGELMDSIIRVSGGYEANLYDGGTLASKLIVEFGLGGIAILVLYLVGLRNLFAYSGKLQKKPYALFSISVYLTFSCYLFVRGMGYMSSTSLLFFFTALPGANLTRFFIKPMAYNFSNAELNQNS